MKKKIKKILSKVGVKKFSKRNPTNRHYLEGKAKNWKMKRDFQFNFLKNQGLNKQDSFLDISCGTLRGSIPIISYLNAGNYTGIDIRKKVLDEGKYELQEENLESKTPSLIHFEDFDKLDLNKKYDVIFAFSVMIHLEDDIAKKCFSFVSKHLKQTGVFYLNVNLENHDDISWQGFPVKFKNIDFYNNLASLAGLSINPIGRLKEFGHISDDTLSDNQMMLEVKKV